MDFDLEAARRRLASFDRIVGREEKASEPKPARLPRAFNRPPVRISRAELREARADSGYAERLIYRYGHERAALIMEGKDPATNEDLAKWRNLGRGKA